MKIPLQQVKYCWECFTFHNGRSSEFEEHCATHLPSMTSQHYEVMVYHHTTIRAGYCIECMWDDKSAAACRMRASDRSNVLRAHLEEHIEQKSWPSVCSDPLCNHVSMNELDYCRNLHDAHHYNKAICVRSGKGPKKRLYTELDKESVTDGNQLDQQKRPHKLQKNPSQPSHASTKDLKIIFWRHPKTQPKAMLSPPANVEDEDQESLKNVTCQTANHYEYFSETPCTRQDSNITCSTSSDVPELTDTSNVCASPFAVSSIPCTVPIDPQILEASSAIPCQSDGGLEQLNECSLSGKLEGYSSVERPEINIPSQMSHNDPTLEGIKPQGITVLESENMPNHQSLTSFSLGKKLERGLTSNEPPTVGVPSPVIQGSFNMDTIGSKAGAEFASTRPFTRSKARKQATKVLQSHTISQKSIQKAKPYSQEEDQLLKRLMKKKTTVQDVTKRFSVHFPGQSTASLQRRWLVIQPPSRRSTRPRSIRHPA